MHGIEERKNNNTTKKNKLELEDVQKRIAKRDWHGGGLTE